MKKVFSLTAVILLICSALFAREYSENEKKFVKGNLSEKTQAVRSASGADSIELTKSAISFALENLKILGNDRDLNALAVTGVLSVSQNMIDSLSTEEKNKLTANLISLYESFDDTNVKVAVLSKIAAINLANDNFVYLLNDYVKKANPALEKHDLLSSSIKTLGVIGNSTSFKILFKCSGEQAWAPYLKDIEDSVGMLASKSENELLEMIRTGNANDCRFIFNFVTKNSKNSQILKAEIAENTLLRAIYIYENTGSSTNELIALQLDSFNVLKEMKWTRASKTAIAYFDVVEKEYSAGKLSEDIFINIISGLSETSPIEAVPKLSSYLTKLNRSMENSSTVISEPVVLAVINALGAIGDKNAFDSLLAVTYYSYSDNVIAAARVALAKLKW